MSADTVTETGPQPLYLPIDQAFHYGVDLRRRNIDLQRVNSSAISGESALVQLIGQDRVQEVHPMLREGIVFLERVQQDVADLRDGINVWGNRRRRDYHPREVVKEYAHCRFAEENDSPEERLSRAMVAMEQTSRLLQGEIQALLSNNRKPLMTARIRLNKKLRELVIPYFNISSRAHFEWRCGCLTRESLEVYEFCA